MSVFESHAIVLGWREYKLFVDFIVPLFEGKTFEQYLIILMVRSLANVVLKKVWARLVLLRQKLMKAAENTRMQKKSHQERTMADLAISATEQIQKHVDKVFNLNWTCYFQKG